MARYCGDRDAGPALDAAGRWKLDCLLRDGSIFGGASLWREAHLSELQAHFVDAPDEGEGTFFTKLELQLSATTPETKQLAAEMLWVMFLCPSNVTPQKKREGIQRVWAWSGASVQALGPWLTDEVLQGVGSAGTSYGVHRWRELAYFIRVTRAFKGLTPAGRQALLDDSWGFAEWLQGIEESNTRQFRHMLLFLLFPDQFERIFGGGDRRLILQNFTGMPRGRIRGLSVLDIDREIAKVRAAEEARHPGVALDFYADPLLEQWQTEDFDGRTAAIEREHVLAALEEIDATGVPKDAESTVYDLIFGIHRYPPKLVLSLASKHAGGAEFDRSLFSGGVGSPAFNLLRSLGFHIERKDFLPSLIRQFLAQASEGGSLTVRGYADSYRGLAVRVSFGKGTLARIPWIAFLGAGQENQRGIYPVLLYYKTDALLVLARGISDTASPALNWPAQHSSETIEQYFVKHFGRSAERYGESFVYEAFRVPDDVQEDSIAEQIDALVAEYLELLRGMDGTPPSVAKDQPPAAPPLMPATVLAVQEPEPPYSVKEATEGLFFPQARFEQILAIWRQKLNLVIQGPPGVGKTFFYRRLAFALMGAQSSSRLTAVQFHPSYAYEDFVQGYRPSPQGFSLRAGVFLRFCERAQADPGHVYVFVIDEINRGNLAKIFGELLVLLEQDKRGPEWAVPLAYAPPDLPSFHIPKNVYILGLMNTADRSLAVVDYALRRRFAFATLAPEYASERFSEHLLEKGVDAALLKKIVTRMTELNARIAADKANLGQGFCLGHSFFCDPPEDASRHAEWFAAVVESEIAPLLREYYFDDSERAEALIQSLL